MKDLQEHNKYKNDKKALLVEKLASDIDKNENYFESDSFVVSLNKGRSVCDLSELGLEYNDKGESVSSAEALRIFYTQMR